jgi:hypothetical protein
MAEIIGQHGIAAFTNPSNGDALDATIVKGNDNSLRAVYVNHDSDPGIHVQSSLLASRPAAGTTGRKWLTTDSGSVKLWYDDGSMWQEISYVPTTGTATVTDLVVTGDVTVDTTTLKVDSTNNRVGVGTATPGATLDVTGTVRSSNTVTVTGGGIAVTGNSTIAGTLSSLTGVTVTGTVTATTFSGSGASLTTLNASNLSSGTVPDARFPATLPAASGVNLTNLNASNLGSGTVATARLPTTIGATTFSVSSGTTPALLATSSTVNAPALKVSGYFSLSFDTVEGLAPGSGDTPVAFGSTVPTDYNNGNWTWVRVQLPGGTAGFLPVLKQV